MHGWKTWIAAAVIGVSAVLRYKGADAIADALLSLGAALGLVGVAHKIEKGSR